jgi:hypothetical protein
MESLWQIIVETVKTLKLASNIEKISDIQYIPGIYIFQQPATQGCIPVQSLIILDKLQPEKIIDETSAIEPRDIYTEQEAFY